MPFTFHPYLMQITSVNSCLFSAYPIALIGKTDSQEDAPFSVAPFISCCDSPKLREPAVVQPAVNKTDPENYRLKCGLDVTADVTQREGSRQPAVEESAKIRYAERHII